MHHDIVITTNRLILRHWRPADTEPYIAMNKDAEVMRYFPSTQTDEQTLAQIERIKAQFAATGYGLYAVERIDNGAFIGYTGFAHPRFESYFTPCIEIGWRLSKENWHQGFATEAAKACIEYGFSQLKLDEIYSWTATINQPSINVMQKAGLQLVGHFDHPLIEDGHVLKQHVIFKISSKS